MKKITVCLLVFCLLASTNLMVFATNDATNVFFKCEDGTNGDLETIIDIIFQNPKEGLYYHYEISPVHVTMDMTVAGFLKNGAYIMTVKAFVPDYVVENADGTPIAESIVATGEDMIFNFVVKKKPQTEESSEPDADDEPLYSEPITSDTTPESPIDLTSPENGNVEAHGLYVSLYEKLNNLKETDPEWADLLINDDWQLLVAIILANNVDDYNGSGGKDYFGEPIVGECRKYLDSLEDPIDKIVYTAVYTAPFFTVKVMQRFGYTEYNHWLEYSGGHMMDIVKNADETVQSAYTAIQDFQYHYYVATGEIFDFLGNAEVLKNGMPEKEDSIPDESSEEEESSEYFNESTEESATSSKDVSETSKEATPDESSEPDESEDSIWGGVIEQIGNNLVGIIILVVLAIAVLAIRIYKKRKTIDEEI